MRCALKRRLCAYETQIRILVLIVPFFGDVFAISMFGLVKAETRCFINSEDQILDISRAENKEQPSPASAGLHAEWADNQASLQRKPEGNRANATSPSDSGEKKPAAQALDEQLSTFVSDKTVSASIQKLQGLVDTYETSFNKESSVKSFDKQFSVLYGKMQSSEHKLERELDKEVPKQERLTAEAMRKSNAFDKQLNKLPKAEQDRIRDTILPRADEDVDSREARVKNDLKDHPELIKPYVAMEEAKFALFAHARGTMRDIGLDIKELNQNMDQARTIKGIVDERAKLFPEDIASEGVRIAGMLDSDRASEGISTLTVHLRELKGERYNQMLQSVEKNDTKGDGVDLTLNNWNPATHTWDKVMVDYSALHTEHVPVRIVAQGNTLSGIAKDWLGPHAGSKQIMNYVDDIANNNGVADTNVIYPAQPLWLPENSLHKFPQAGD